MNKTLHQLLYVSVEARRQSEEDLVSLLEQSRANNEISGVTGMLVYYKRHFLQILEGDKETAFDLFGKIRKDERHGSVILFWDQAIEKRSFDRWTMAFVNLNTVDPARLHGFSEFLKKGFQELSDENLTTAQKLLVQCKDFLN